MFNSIFGTDAASNVYSGQYLRSNNIALPTGRQMANGSTAVLISSVGMYVAGRYSARTISMAVGTTQTDSFTVPSANVESYTGQVALTPFLVNGGTTTVTLYTNNTTCWFGRSSSSGTSNTFSESGYGYTGTLAGSFEYAQAPTLPQSFSAIPGGTGTVNLSWIAPIDDGGASVDDYVIQYSTSSTFATGVTTTTSVLTSRSISGLGAGVYYFRVAARNAVTDLAGTWSAYSTTEIATVASPPSAPGSITGVVGPDLSHWIWVTPDNNGSAIQSIELQVSTSFGFSSYQSFMLPPNATSKTTTGLSPATTWYARVRAINAAGIGALSSTASVTTPARTYQDTVAMASITLSNSFNVEIRSTSLTTPTLILTFADVNSGATVYGTIDTIPTGNLDGQFATPAGPDGIAITADDANNIYVIGRNGSSGDLLIKRYTKANAVSNVWYAGGSAAQTLVSTAGDPYTQFAAEFVPGTIPSIFVLARRAGLPGVGTLSYATVSIPVLSGATPGLPLIINQGTDPSFLSAPGVVGLPNGSKLDVSRLSTAGNRLAIGANGFAVVDVINGVVSSVSKSSDGTVLNAGKIRIVPISSERFALINSEGYALNISFYSVNGSQLRVETIPSTNAYTPGFVDNWDAYYNRQDGLIHVVYTAASSGRTIAEVTYSPSTYVAGTPTNLTTTMGATGTVSTKLKMTSGPAVDERRMLITSATLTGSTQGLGSYIDLSGNVPPTTPALNTRIAFDARTSANFSWVFGDQNTYDLSGGAQLLIHNETNNVPAYDSGVVGATSNFTLPASTLTNNKDYSWKVRSYDALTAVSAYSTNGTFRTSDSGIVTITSPATDSPVSDVSYQAIVWSYSSSNPSSIQAKYRVRVYNHTTNVLLQDTGYISSTATSHTVTNLLSGVAQRVEVTVITNDGLESIPGTRVLNPEFAAPLTPTYLVRPLDTYIELTIDNPSGGSNPEVVINEIWKRSIADSTSQFVHIGHAPTDGVYRDYAVASNTSYEYYIRALSGDAYADSIVIQVTALDFTGNWLHDVTDPIGTVRQYTYGSNSRSEAISVQAMPIPTVGREYPIVDFGINEMFSISLNIVLPSDDSLQGAIQSLRDLINARSTLCFRDGRGRLHFGTVSALQITDIVYGASISLVFTANNYTEEL